MYHFLLIRLVAPRQLSTLIHPQGIAQKCRYMIQRFLTEQMKLNLYLWSKY